MRLHQRSVAKLMTHDGEVIWLIFLLQNLRRAMHNNCRSASPAPNFWGATNAQPIRLRESIQSASMRYVFPPPIRFTNTIASGVSWNCSVGASLRGRPMAWHRGAPTEGCPYKQKAQVNSA